VAEDAPMADRALLLGRLQDLGVDLRTETRILRADPDAVCVEGPGGSERLPCDTVVLCLGMQANDGLASAVQSQGREVFVVGDAVEPRKVTEAMVEGARAALSLA
jgi:NADH dehydrogenase FAD-containing subunit